MGIFSNKSQISTIQAIIIALVVLIIVLSIIMLANPKLLEAFGIGKTFFARPG